MEKRTYKSMPGAAAPLVLFLVVRIDRSAQGVEDVRVVRYLCKCPNDI